MMLFYSGYQVYHYYSEAQKQTEQFEELADLIESPVSTSPDETTPEQTAYEKYAALFGQNPDMVGWIRIDGTTINYPVMQTPDRASFYLKHNFNKEYSDLGVPFVSEACDLNTSDNIVIFGHHIKGGKMFGALESYKSKEFFLEHLIIEFDTIEGFGKYEIIAVFRTAPYKFRYNEFIKAENQANFYEFIKKCKLLSFYDSGKTAEYGDRLLTLSTCEYSEKNSRLVVIAKKMPCATAGE